MDWWTNLAGVQPTQLPQRCLKRGLWKSFSRLLQLDSFNRVKNKSQASGQNGSLKKDRVPKEWHQEVILRDTNQKEQTLQSALNPKRGFCRIKIYDLGINGDE